MHDKLACYWKVADAWFADLVIGFFRFPKRLKLRWLGWHVLGRILQESHIRSHLGLT